MQINSFPQCAYLSQKYSIHKKKSNPCVKINADRENYYSKLSKNKTFIIFQSKSSLRNLLSTNTSLNNNSSRYKDHFDQLQKLTDLGHKVVFLYGVPRPKINSRKLLNKLMIKNYEGPSLFGNQTKYDVDIANIHIKQQLLRFKDNRKFLALDISDILCEPYGEAML